MRRKGRNLIEKGCECALRNTLDLETSRLSYHAGQDGSSRLGYEIGFVDEHVFRERGWKTVWAVPLHGVIPHIRTVKR